jgi:hypothetical protein
MTRWSDRLGDERGFVATELALGIGLLVLPVALLVLTLPGWSERQVTARAVAREVARATARSGRCDRLTAQETAATMARNLGLDAGDLAVGLACTPGAELVAGSELEADVTVRMPAVEIPGVGAVGEWSWTARHREPVDRFGATP